MPWKRIEIADRDGTRLIVAGGVIVRGEAGGCRQRSPSMVTWDGSEWVICDTATERAVIKDPRWWCEVPRPPDA